MLLQSKHEKQPIWKSIGVQLYEMALKNSSLCSISLNWNYNNPIKNLIFQIPTNKSRYYDMRDWVFTQTKSEWYAYMYTSIIKAKWNASSICAQNHKTNHVNHICLTSICQTNVDFSIHSFTVSESNSLWQMKNWICCLIRLL